MPQRAAKERVAIRRELSGRVLLASGVLVAAAWFVSRWYILWLWCDRSGTTTGYGIGRGMFGVREFVSYPTGEWNCLGINRIPTPGWVFWQWQPQTTSFTTLAISFWPLAIVLLAAGAALLMWVRSERAATPSAASEHPAPSHLPPPRGRGRIAAGVVLLALGLLTGCVWVASSRWTVEAQRNSWTVNVSSGLLTVTHGIDANQWLRWRWEKRPSGDPSFFWQAREPSGASAVAIASGGPGLFPPFPTAQMPTAEWRWWIVGGMTQRSDKIRMLALWPFPLLMLGCGAPLLWSGIRTRQRTRAGLCPACGYDRAGLAAGAPCPECGNAPVGA